MSVFWALFGAIYVLACRKCITLFLKSLEWIQMLTSANSNCRCNLKTWMISCICWIWRQAKAGKTWWPITQVLLRSKYLSLFCWMSMNISFRMSLIVLHSASCRCMLFAHPRMFRACIPQGMHRFRGNVWDYDSRPQVMQILGYPIQMT